MDRSEWAILPPSVSLPSAASFFIVLAFFLMICKRVREVIAEEGQC